MITYNNSSLLFQNSNTIKTQNVIFRFLDKWLLCIITHINITQKNIITQMYSAKYITELFSYIIYSSISLLAN